MALRHLSTPPTVEDFTPLEEHQQQTPSTFFGAKPVLYAQHSGLTVSAPTNQLSEDAAFSKFHSTRDEQSEDLLLRNVEIWVNSENLILFQNTPTPTGVAVPYPSIALHATMKWKSRIDALYMNLSLNDAESVNAEEDINVLELTILPPAYETDRPQTTCVNEIFNAMNTCADLHPDPENDDGDDDETAPGATGWITADNMDDFLDEEGNFRGTVIGAGEELGPGAGTVRPREDGEEDSNGVNGVDGSGHEDKYQRTG